MSQINNLLLSYSCIFIKLACDTRMKKEQTSAILKLFLKLDTSGKILNLLWIFPDLKAGKRYFLLDVKLQMTFSLKNFSLSQVEFGTK